MSNHDKKPTRDEIFQLQDDVLISITTPGRPFDHAALRRLPPWRAVLLGRVAYKAGAMNRELLDRLVREAQMVGGGGRLRSWESEERLVRNIQARVTGREK